MINMEFEAIIGLEIHVQMKTNSKMFSSAPVTFGYEPNTQADINDLAFPGTMPTINKQAVINAIRVCNALHMEIDDTLLFDRKNYFYSDLSKGYQITQQFRPIGRNGYLTIKLNGEDKTIGIVRLHIEEDASDIWGDFFDVDDNPGDRRTDIVLENKVLNLQLIFDAKYYKDTFVNAYMNPDDERARTAHLNQVRGYLIDSDFPGEKIGALLYPMTNDDVSKGKMYPIQGANIMVKTINLDTEWRNIEADLFEFLRKFELGYEKKISLKQ